MQDQFLDPNHPLSNKLSIRIGSRYPDTVYVDDRRLQNEHSTKQKIKSIRILHNDSLVHGLEFVYTNGYNTIETSSGPHIGKDVYGYKSNEIMVQLEDDEFVVQISGRSGGYIDYIAFVTSKGKRIEGGGAKGGEPFTHQAIHGNHFALVNVGVGGHIHFIDCFQVPISEFSNSLIDFEPIIEVPTTESQLGDATPTTHPFYKITKRTCVKTSGFFGYYKSDCITFDDYHEKTSKSFFDSELSELIIYHNGQVILGFETTYKNPVDSFTKLRHIPADCDINSPSVKQEKLKLNNVEKIEEIMGSIDKYFTCLKIVTTSGKKIIAGRPGGDTFDNMLSPECNSIKGFGGSIGAGGLQTLYFHFL